MEKSKRIDLARKTFGRLTVIKFHHKDAAHRTYWLCKCECGQEKVLRVDHFKSGAVQSCGCFHSEAIRRGGINLKHGQYGTRLYRIYHNMIKRCHNPKATRYKDWGGRGIHVCDEWRNSFSNFYDWAINNGYQEHLTLDRADNDKGYSPENCRWVTYKQQNENKRNSAREGAFLLGA